MKIDDTILPSTTTDKLDEGFTFGNKQIYQIVKPEAHSILVGIEYEYNVDDETASELGVKYDIGVESVDEEPELDEDAYMEAVDSVVEEHMTNWKSEYEDSYVESRMDELNVDSLQSGIKTIIKNIQSTGYLTDEHPIKDIDTLASEISTKADDIWLILNHQQEEGKEKTLSILSQDEIDKLREILKLSFLIRDFKKFLEDSKLNRIDSNVDFDNYEEIYGLLSGKIQSSIDLDADELRELYSEMEDIDGIDQDDLPLIAGANQDTEQDIILFDEYYDDILVLLNSLRDGKIISKVGLLYDKLVQFHDNFSSTLAEKRDWEDIVRDDVRENFDIDDMVSNREVEGEEESARQNAYERIDQSDYYIENNNSGNLSSNSKVQVIDAALMDSNNKWGIDYDSEISEVTDDQSVPEGVETISKAIPLLDQIKLMEKMFNHIQDVGSTEHNTGMHVNMSIKGLNFTKDNFDPVKMVVLLNNNYLIGKSVDKKGNPILKYPVRGYVSNMLSQVNVETAFMLAKEYVAGGYKNLINEFSVLIQRDRKHQGINFNNTFSADMEIDGESTRRVEFRYMGNEGYDKRLEEMTFDIYRFAYAMMAGYSPAFGQEDYYKAIVKELDKVIAGELPNMKFSDFISAVKKGNTRYETIGFDEKYKAKRKYFEELIKIIQDKLKEEEIHDSYVTFNRINRILEDEYVTRQENNSNPAISTPKKSLNIGGNPLNNIPFEDIAIIKWKLNPDD